MVYELRYIPLCRDWHSSRQAWENLTEYIERICFIDQDNHLTTEQDIADSIAAFEMKTKKHIVESIYFLGEIMHWIAIRKNCRIAEDNLKRLYIYGGLWICKSTIVK